jgi:hypothetical protein
MKITLQIRDPYDFRLKSATGLVILSIAVTYLLNAVLPMINLATDLWEYPSILPFIHPVGTDFRQGLFYPAKVLLQGKSPYVDYSQIYPPLTNVIAIPFRLFPVQTAYIIQVILLFVLNLVTIFITLSILKMLFSDFFKTNPVAASLIANVTFLLMCFYAVTSYGFVFSAERGNYDIYVMFFSILGLWVLIKKPDQLWLQVLLFSIATHLKIYPAILFTLIIWKHRWKSILPILSLNLIFLFIIGPINAIQFLKTLINYMSHPFVYIGNQSGIAFGTLLNHSLTNHFGFTLPVILFVVIPILIWLIGFVFLYKRQYTPIHAVLLFAISVPVMNLVPGTSYDYKLVILSAPLLIVLFILLHAYADQGKLIDLGRLAILILTMYMLARSPAFIQGLLASKYPFNLLLQLVILSLILFPVRQTVVFRQAGSIPKELT